MHVAILISLSHVLTLDCKALKANPLTVNSQDKKCFFIRNPSFSVSMFSWKRLRDGWIPERKRNKNVMTVVLSLSFLYERPVEHNLHLLLSSSTDAWPSTGGRESHSWKRCVTAFKGIRCLAVTNKLFLSSFKDLWIKLSFIIKGKFGDPRKIFA